MAAGSKDLARSVMNRWAADSRSAAAHEEAGEGSGIVGRRHHLAMLELALLGSPEVRRDGLPWRPPTKKSVALLAIVAADGAMPRGRLCALLWPELDEAAARRNLRRELARLREGGLG